NSIGHALRRVLVEIEAGRAEREFKVGDDRVEREVAGDGEGNIMRDRGSADAALRPRHRRDAAEGPRIGCRKDPGDCTNGVGAHGRSRSAMTVSSERSRAREKAILCPTVEAPTPPFAPTTAMTRPTGSESGAENTPETARTMSSGASGEIR